MLEPLAWVFRLHNLKSDIFHGAARNFTFKFGRTLTPPESSMAKWRCTVCNYVYDEEKEGVSFADLPAELGAA